MARYFAQIVDPLVGDTDPRPVVARVIVVESADLAAQLTGTLSSQWLETTQDDPVEAYAGKGDRYDPGKPERFEPAQSRRRRPDVGPP